MLCNIEKNLTTPYPFNRNVDDTYQITVQLSVWLTEQLVTVGSVTLRFYCIIINSVMTKKSESKVMMILGKKLNANKAMIFTMNTRKVII